MEILTLLIYLGKRGAIGRGVTLTTSKMGSDLGISQQSVSRWLITLEREGLISRREGIRGYLLQITRKGKSLMQETSTQLNEILAESGKIVMQGKVVPGMQDGKYYLGLREYAEKIKHELGFKPYPGTFNIVLRRIEGTLGKEKLCAMPGTDIPGFRQDDRIFGSIKCFECKINGIAGAVVIPERSHYGFEVLEVISPFNLRNKLRVSDGDDIKVEVLVG